MKLFLSLIVLISYSAFANECAELSKCVEYVSKLTGKKYLFDAKSVRGGLESSSNTQINAENADTLFTYILDLNGYVRVPTAEKDTYIIIEARDIRYHTLPIVEVDAQHAPKIPKNYDYYLMSYKFKHHTYGQAREASNSIRPFMSRYARIIELKGAGNVFVQENASNLMNEYEIIKAADRELTKEEIKAYKEQEKERMEERKEEKRAERKHEKQANAPAEKSEIKK